MDKMINKVKRTLTIIAIILVCLGFIYTAIDNAVHPAKESTRIVNCYDKNNNIINNQTCTEKYYDFSNQQIAIPLTFIFCGFILFFISGCFD